MANKSLSDDKSAPLLLVDISSSRFIKIFPSNDDGVFGAGLTNLRKDIVNYCSKQEKIIFQ